MTDPERDIALGPNRLESARRGHLRADVHPLRSTGRSSAASGTLSGPAQLERWRLVAKCLTA